MERGGGAGESVAKTEASSSLELIGSHDGRAIMQR